VAAGRRARGRSAATGPGAWSVGHGRHCIFCMTAIDGPVQLRPVRATRCLVCGLHNSYVITLAESSGKRNVMVWRPSVCLFRRHTHQNSPAAACDAAIVHFGPTYLLLKQLGSF